MGNNLYRQKNKNYYRGKEVDILIILKNGLYKTEEDFPEMQNKFTELINAYTNNNKEDRCRNITFVVTEECNLRCSYCYQANKTFKTMTKETAKQAVDFILDKKLINGYYDPDTSPSVILDFIGGEPLLNIDIIDYIVEYFKFKTFEMNHPWSENYFINITTNGTLYNNKNVQDFLKRNKGKVNTGITIDGNKRLHDSCRKFPDGSGSYDIVKKSIDIWLKNENNPETKITLCPSNIMYLNEAIKNVWDIGVIGAKTNCVFEEGWKNEDAKILYSQMKLLADYLLENERYKKYMCSLFDEKIGKKEESDANFCGGNGHMLAISPEGKCYPCIRFMKYSLVNQEEICIGDIWNGINTKNKWLLKLSDITRTSQLHFSDNKKCIDCPISSGCPHCTGYNYDRFGDPNHKATFICEMQKARVLANIYYWNKLYKKVNIDKHFECNLKKEDALKIVTENEYNYLKNLAKGVI